MNWRIRYPIHWRLLGLILLVMLCAIGALFVMRTPPYPPPVVIFSQPYVFPQPRRGLLDRIMPRNPAWAWLWRLRYAVFGKTKSVTINTDFVELLNSEDLVAKLRLGGPEYSGAEGLRVWRLGGLDLNALRLALIQSWAKQCCFAEGNHRRRERVCHFLGFYCSERRNTNSSWFQRSIYATASAESGGPDRGT